MNEDASTYRQLARHSALSFTVISIIGAVLTIFCWHYIGGVTLWQWFGALAVASFCSLIALLGRRLPAAASAALFLICAATLLIASAISNDQLVRQREPFVAFNGYKIAAVIIAVMAPIPVWVGYLLISVCAVAPVVQFFSLPADLRQVFPAEEPVQVVIFAVLAFFIFRHRIHARELERTLLRLKADQRAKDDLAAIFVGLRDLTNTPLQSIELTATLLASKDLQQEDAARHLEVSLVKLRELTIVLSRFEKEIDSSKTASSFNAVAMLQAKIAELEGRLKSRSEEIR